MGTFIQHHIFAQSHFNGTRWNSKNIVFTMTLHISHCGGQIHPFKCTHFRKGHRGEFGNGMRQWLYCHRKGKKREIGRQGMVREVESCNFRLVECALSVVSQTRGRCCSIIRTRDEHAVCRSRKGRRTISLVSPEVSLFSQ